MQAAAFSRPIQLHLALFPQHVIDAVTQEEDRRSQIRAKRHGAYVARVHRSMSAKQALIESLNPSFLDAPLVPSMGTNELDCAVDPLTAVDDFALEPERSGEVGDAWSDQATYELHEAVLHHTLKVLGARGNGAEKRDALLWVFAPVRYVATLNVNGHEQEVILPPELTPFSFEMCCRICGYRSELLTDLLEPILRKLGLGELFNEISNATSNTICGAQCADHARAEDVQGAGDLQLAQPA
jgi:hypothetical protein